MKISLKNRILSKAADFLLEYGEFAVRGMLLAVLIYYIVTKNEDGVKSFQ